MALPCSIGDDDDKLDAIDFAHWILVCDLYLMKATYLLAMNHTLSNLQVIFMLSKELPQALNIVFKKGDETLLMTHGGVYASDLRKDVEQAFQATSN